MGKPQQENLSGTIPMGKSLWDDSNGPILIGHFQWEIPSGTIPNGTIPHGRIPTG